ncbi:hypothetical protein [Aureispira sp. CCB-E]|uniref:hypothetical protein n=1 Tax=Aureispira sp. CCB-E TaxID=3051121 RepID=UPI0028688BB5|nr:hypothetical protein [Aureispira sp. CCB-E]WMX14625.1 hypothetical protein QP953_27585 [Aureispira sp. CCB-E]
MKETTFLGQCKGVALVFSAVALLLFGAAALVYSASPVQANHEPKTTYGTGKYMMSLSSIYGEGRANWYILVWDTETGRSKFYYGNKNEGMNAANGQYQIPASPL